MRRIGRGSFAARRRASCSIVAAAIAGSANARAVEAQASRSEDAQVTPTLSEEEIPSHPIFVALTAGGELGGAYAGDLTVSVLGNPWPSGVSLGGSLFVAPITDVPHVCTPCDYGPLLVRGMAEARLGTAYRKDSPSLAWVRVGAGIAYLDEPHLVPSPSFAVAAGGDVRLSERFWFELSPRATWSQMIGSASPFSGTYISFGLDLGVRFDLER